MKKYSLRYALYCMLFTEVAFVILLCLFASGGPDFSFKAIREILFSLYSLIIQISLYISSKVSFRLLYKKNRFAKPWIVGGVNFLLFYIFVVVGYVLCSFMVDEKYFGGFGVIITLIALLWISWLLIAAYIFFAGRLRNKFNQAEDDLQ